MKRGKNHSPTLPADYVQCSQCGFSHDYESTESNRWHIQYDAREEIANVRKHIEILVTGCGYESADENDPAWVGCESNEFILWRKNRAFVVTIERSPEYDEEEE